MSVLADAVWPRLIRPDRRYLPPFDVDLDTLDPRPSHSSVAFTPTTNTSTIGKQRETGILGTCSAGPSRPPLPAGGSSARMYRLARRVWSHEPEHTVGRLRL
jgi:hypothetical protein